MAETLKLSSDKQRRSGKVEIDGHIWSVSMPGANSELRFSQLARDAKRLNSRMAMLDKKIEDGSITSDELDQYDATSKEAVLVESEILGFYSTFFKDNTADNSEVKKWVSDTPLNAIIKVFEEITQKNNEGTHGQDLSSNA